MKRLRKVVGRIAISLTLLLGMSMQSFAAEAPEASSDVLVTDAREKAVVDAADIVTRAGNETWTGSGFGGAFRFTDYNLTPVKTMGKSGTLLISGYFYGDDGYADSSPIKLTFQIRTTSGAVKSQTIVPDTRNGDVSFSTSCHVNAGDQIQLFMDASSIGNPPGITRSAYIAYNYYLY